MRAVVIFTLPRPRPGNEAIGNLEEVNGRLSSWRGMAAQHSLWPFVISFHAKSRKIWLKQAGSLHFLLNRKRLCAAPIVKIGRCHWGQGTLPVSILRPSCYLSKQRMLQSCATLVVKSRASVEREIPINFASLLFRTK